MDEIWFRIIILIVMFIIFYYTITYVTTTYSSIIHTNLQNKNDDDFKKLLMTSINEQNKLKSEIQSLKEQIADKNSEISQFQLQLNEKNKIINQYEIQIHELESKIKILLNSIKLQNVANKVEFMKLLKCIQEMLKGQKDLLNSRNKTKYSELALQALHEPNKNSVIQLILRKIKETPQNTNVIKDLNILLNKLIERLSHESLGYIEYQQYRSGGNTPRSTGKVNSDIGGGGGVKKSVIDLNALN